VGGQVKLSTLGGYTPEVENKIERVAFPELSGSHHFSLERI